MKFEKELIALIKEKDELSSLDDSFIKSVLDEKFSFISDSVFDKYISFQQCKRGRKCKEIVTNVRKYLRTVYGLFILDPVARFQKSIFSLKSFESESVDKLLLFHQSTKERFSSYDEFYSKIFSYLFSQGLSSSFTLADLACGYNPFSYKYFPTKPKKYVVSDLSSQDMSLIQSFFDNTSIRGKAIAFDLLSKKFSSWISNQWFDVIFLLKAVDSLEFVKRHSSKKILSALPASFLVVSFPLVSIGGKQSIAGSKRWWFERFCQNNNWSFESFVIGDELVYVVVTYKQA